MSAARQSAPTDKLLNPPHCGGRLHEKSGFRSAERCLRSLSRQVPAIQMKFPEVDMVFIGKSDRLLGLEDVDGLVGKPEEEGAGGEIAVVASAVDIFQLKAVGGYFGAALR
jgi:hypothetical protein